MVVLVFTYLPIQLEICLEKMKNKRKWYLRRSSISYKIFFYKIPRPQAWLQNLALKEPANRERAQDLYLVKIAWRLRPSFRSLGTNPLKKIGNTEFEA